MCRPRLDPETGEKKGIGDKLVNIQYVHSLDNSNVWMLISGSSMVTGYVNN